MFKAFNSLQITIGYALSPLGLGWLWNQEGAWGYAFWPAVVGYVIFTGLMAGAVYHAFDEKNSWW
jgi:hypothetical protein